MPYLNFQSETTTCCVLELIETFERIHLKDENSTPRISETMFYKEDTDAREQ